MMRLPKASLVKLLWRNCNFSTAVRVGKHCRWQTPICGFPPFQTRTLCTTLVTRKESDQANEKLNLDIWKSVMMSPGPQEEKGKEEEALGESGEEAECSPLAATREMVEMMRQAGRNVPEHLSDNDLLSLQEHTTKTARKKFLKFLALKESYKKARKQEKEKRKSESQPQEEEEEEARVSLNSYLITKRGRYLNSGCKWRAAQAMLFGQSLVFDMSYEAVMNQRELSNTISQLQECLTWNKRSLEPFHIHFCNLQPNSGYKRELTSRYGDSWDNLLITATEQRHVDMFPHKQLVYLTADSPNVLRSFDHNKVYIVGALVDKADQSSVSLTNAKRLKLDTARFPLDHFLQWDSGAKNLTLDQVMRILLTLRDTGKWEQALEFVPKRKHSGFYPKNLVEGPVKMFTDVARMKFKKRAKKFTFSETGSVRDAGHKPLTQPGVRNVFKPKQFMEPDGKAKGRKNWGGNHKTTDVHKEQPLKDFLSRRHVALSLWNMLRPM